MPEFFPGRTDHGGLMPEFFQERTDHGGLVPESFLERIEDALNSNCGPEQQALAERGIQITAMLLRKNSDYGASGFDRPYLLPELSVKSALLCRMSDKIARIRNLLSGATAQVEEESVEDTLMDLAGYIVLYLSSSE